MTLDLNEEQTRALRMTVSDDLHRCRTSARIYAETVERSTDAFVTRNAQREAEHFAWRAAQLDAVLKLIGEQN